MTKLDFSYDKILFQNAMIVTFIPMLFFNNNYYHFFLSKSRAHIRLLPINLWEGVENWGFWVLYIASEIWT